MRILLVSSSSGSRGGGELFLLGLAEALGKLGHQPSLWVSDHPRMDELAARFETFGPVRRQPYRNTYDRRLRSFSDAFDRRSAERVATDWKALAPDVLHLNKQNLEDGLDLLRAAGRSALPSICTVHVSQTAVYLGARQARARDAVARHALRRYPGLLVAIGESRRDDLARFVGSRRAVRLALVENGVHVPGAEELRLLRETTRDRLGCGAGALLVLGVGRMVEQKRPLLFLEQARALAAIDPQAVFCWVGDGPLRPEWDDAVGRFGLTGRVRNPGWAGAVLPYYAAADAFLHTAGYEGLPLALLEAMAAGLPCAVTPNLMEDLDFLKSGGVVRTDDPGWIAAVRDPARRAALGTQNVCLVRQRFSIERMTQEYLALYGDACARQR